MSKEIKDFVEDASTGYEFERLSTVEKQPTDQKNKGTQRAEVLDPSERDEFDERETKPRKSEGDSMHTEVSDRDLSKWVDQASNKREHRASEHADTPKKPENSDDPKAADAAKPVQAAGDEAKHSGTEKPVANPIQQSAATDNVAQPVQSVAKTEKIENRPLPRMSTKASSQRGADHNVGRSSGMRSGVSRSGSVPKIEPKGAGQGAHPMESFSNSGLSYQIEHYHELGKEATGDVDDSSHQIQNQLPGDEKASLDDSKDSQKIRKAAHETKSANQSVGKKSLKSSSSANTVNRSTSKTKDRVESQKRQAKRGKPDQIPAKPTVDADMSVIEQSQAVEAEKFAAAQSAGAERVSDIDRTLPERDFEEVKVPRAEIIEPVQAIESGKLPESDEIATLDAEAKGLLDASEIADPALAQMQVASEQIDQAKAASQSATEAEIANHTEAIDKAKADANQKEQNLIANKKEELDKQLDDESNRYDQEITAYDEAQQKDIEDAKEKIEAERTKAQTTIDTEHAKADDEKKKAEDESNDDKSLAEKAADWLKTQAARLKKRITAIISAVQEAICRVLDNFVAAVSAINKDLGDKLQKSVNKLKEALDALSKRLIEIANIIIDVVVNAITEIAEQLVAAIRFLVDALKMAIHAIIEGLKAAYHDVIQLAKSILSGLSDLFEAILRKACDFIGMDPEPLIEAAKNIVKNPKGFFKTLWAGIKEGASNFIKNFGANALVMLRNLFAIWLEPSGITIPTSIPSLAGFIELGLSILGINISGILSKLQEAKASAGESESEEDQESGDVFSDDSGLDQVLEAIKTGGVSVLLGYILPNLGGIDTEIIQAVIADLIPSLITKGLAKLVSMANPATGILSAIKSVWDLTLFFIERFEAIKGLVTAVTNVLVKCANGDSSAAANAFEATLCQVLPLAVDLILRLIGINVGGAIKKVVTRVGGKIRAVIDKFIGKFNKRTGAHLKTSKQRAKAKKEQAQKLEDNKRVRERMATQENNQDAQRGLRGDKRSAHIAARREILDNKAFDITGTANAISGNKVGNFGYNINKSKYVQAIDEHGESRHLHRRLDKVGGDPSKLSSADQRALLKEQMTGSNKTLTERLSKVHQDKVEARQLDRENRSKYKGEKLDQKRRIDKNIKESETARNSSNFDLYLNEQARLDGRTFVDDMSPDDAARYEAYWASKEGEIAETERQRAEEASRVIRLTPEELEAENRRGEEVLAASARSNHELREKYKDMTFDSEANIAKRVEIEEARQIAKANGWFLRDENGQKKIDDYGREMVAWPDNTKQYDALPGTMRNETIAPGTVISRYSYSQYDEEDRTKTKDTGTYFSPDGVDPAKRAMSDTDKGKPEYKFRVLKPIDVVSSYATPWFDKEGLGKQYNSESFMVYDEETKQMASATMQVLLRNGYIERI